MVSELFTQFRSLTSRNDGTFDVLSLANMPHKLGKSAEAYPIFFVENNDSSGMTQNLTMELLSVQYNQNCTFIDESGVQHTDERYTVITLRTTEEALQTHFIDIFFMMLHKLPLCPSRRELSAEIEDLITIFSAVSRPPRKQIQGLWAELLVIEKSRFPETLISAWHSQPAAKYDFTLGRDKIEVKSTSSSDRKHHFSLDQLNPSPNSRLLIASSVVRESAHSATGISVIELYEKIRTKGISIQSQLRLYQIIADTIGSDFSKLNDMFFDYVEASDTLAFYDSNLIPHIRREDVPNLVTDVSFSCTISGIPSITEEGGIIDTSNSPLFNSLI